MSDVTPDRQITGLAPRRRTPDVSRLVRKTRNQTAAPPVESAPVEDAPVESAGVGETAPTEAVESATVAQQDVPETKNAAAGEPQGDGNGGAAEAEHPPAPTTTDAAAADSVAEVADDWMEPRSDASTTPEPSAEVGEALLAAEQILSKPAPAPAEPAARSAASPSRVQLTVYMAPANRDRAKAAFRETNHLAGDVSWSEFVELAVLAEVERREQTFNGGARFTPDGAKLRPGRRPSL